MTVLKQTSNREITRLKLIHVCLLRNRIKTPLYNINKIERALQHETCVEAWFPYTGLAQVKKPCAQRGPGAKGELHLESNSSLLF